MKFAKYTFYAAAIYGILALAPQYFLEEKTARDFPHAVARPEFYYGFIGVALAWQIAFLLIARQPARFRSLMPVAVLEKLSFGVPAVVLFFGDRIPAQMLAAGLVDLILAAFFVVAYLKTPNDVR